MNIYEWMPELPHDTRERWFYARAYGVRCYFPSNAGWNKVTTAGYALFCFLGPRGGKYVYIVTDQLRVTTRHIGGVSYDYRWNRDEPYRLEQQRMRG